MSKRDYELLAVITHLPWLSQSSLITAGVPYDLSPEFLQELFTKHRVDYIIHGDDPCLLPDGTDAYAHAKKLGRFRMVCACQNRERN